MEVLPDNSEVPDAKAVSRQSNIFREVNNADCIPFMRILPDAFVDLIVTDPPYLMSYATNHRKDKGHPFCVPIAGDRDKNLIQEAIKECYRILKPDTAMYMFCNMNHVDFFKLELEKYFTIKNMIIWVKNNWTAGDLKAQFGKQYELIFLVNKGRKPFNGKRITDVWNFSRVAGKAQVHQNEKPVDLLELAIEKHSVPGDLVFDPFMGSGSTGVAAKNLNRKFMGVEIEEKYCIIAEERLRDDRAA